MTAWDAAATENLAAQAAAVQVRPGRVLATVIGAFFFAAGWLAGALWRALVFAALAIRYGAWRGAGLTDEDIAARAAARAAAKAPPPEPSPR
jgi:hypothetical protein